MPFHSDSKTTQKWGPPTCPEPQAGCLQDHRSMELQFRPCPLQDRLPDALRGVSEAPEKPGLPSPGSHHSHGMNNLMGKLQLEISKHHCGEQDNTPSTT